MSQRFVLREYLGRLESLLGSGEMVRVLSPGWWRARRCLVMVTTSRLLLHRPSKCSSMHQLTFPLQLITHFGVHAIPPEGARFRLVVGLDLEEFFVARGADDLERDLREAMA